MDRKMKDSGIEWIGQIPEDWEMIRVKNIFSHHKDIVGEKENEYERLALTLNGVVKRSKEDSKGLQSESFSTYQILNKDELVFKMIDLENISTSRVGYSPYTGLVSPVYIILNNESYSKFGYYYFYNLYQRAIFNQLGNNGVRSALNASDMLGLPFPKISIEEANKIVVFLDGKVSKIDKAISDTKSVIEDYKKYKQAIITEVVTRGLNPDVKMKDSNVEYWGEIPQNWDVLLLALAFDFVSGYAFKSEWFCDETNCQVLKIGNIKNDKLLVNEKQSYVLPKYVVNAEKCKICIDDILFTMTGTKGKGDYFYSLLVKPDDLKEKDLYINQRVGCFRKKYKKVYMPFYNYLLKTENIRQYVFLSETGTANQGNIGIEDINTAKLLLPPMNEQQEIVEYLDKKCAEIDKLIEAKENLITELEAYKKSLIYEYVTGKREVPEVKVVPFPAVVNCKNKRFAQAVLLTKVLDEFGDYHSGRVKVAKTLYVLENHIGFDFEADPIRKIAGPLDKQYYDAEAIVRHNNWFNVLEDTSNVRFFAGKEKAKYLDYYEKYFKDYDTEIQRIINIFKNLNMNEAELLATAYASWNDFVIKGEDFTNDDIVEDIFAWDDSKKRFTKEVWLKTLIELDSKGLHPAGHGKITTKEE